MEFHHSGKHEKMICFQKSVYLDRKSKIKIMMNKERRFTNVIKHQMVDLFYSNTLTVRNNKSTICYMIHHCCISCLCMIHCSHKHFLCWNKVDLDVGHLFDSMFNWDKKTNQTLGKWIQGNVENSSVWSWPWNNV